MFEALSKAELPYPYCEYSSRHIRRLVKAGKFPTPIRVGRFDIWPKAVIEVHMASLQQTGAGEPKKLGAPFTPEEARAAVEKRWAKERARRAAAEKGAA